MRASQLSKRLNVHHKTVVKWIKGGLLEATMRKPEWGGHPYYDISEENLIEYLEKYNKKELLERFFSNEPKEEQTN